jgi:hypothetical protein
MGSARTIGIIIAVVLSACAAEPREPLTPPAAPAPRALTPREQSLLLKLGMSEKEVIKLLGPPSKVEAGTCGGKTPKPWTCKTLTYGDAFGLRAYFAEDAGEWRLNNWSVI